MFKEAHERYLKDLTDKGIVVDASPDPQAIQLKKRRGQQAKRNMARDLIELYMYRMGYKQEFPRDVVSNTKGFLDAHDKSQHNRGKSVTGESIQVGAQTQADIYLKLDELAAKYKTLEEKLGKELKTRDTKIERLSEEVKELRTKKHDLYKLTDASVDTVHETLRASSDTHDHAKSADKHANSAPATAGNLRGQHTQAIKPNKDIARGKDNSEVDQTWPAEPCRKERMTDLTTCADDMNGENTTEAEPSVQEPGQPEGLFAESERQQSGTYATSPVTTNTQTQTADPARRYNGKKVSSSSSSSSPQSVSSSSSGDCCNGGSSSSCSSNITHTYSDVLKVPGDWNLTITKKRAKRIARKEQQKQQKTKLREGPAKALKGCKPEKGVMLYVENIQLDYRDTDEDIAKMVRDNAAGLGIRILSAYVIHIRGHPGIVGCKITVPLSQIGDALDDSFWPQDVKCRKWETRPRRNKQEFKKHRNGLTEEYPSHQDPHTSVYQRYDGFDRTGHQGQETSVRLQRKGYEYVTGYQKIQYDSSQDSHNWDQRNYENDNFADMRCAVRDDGPDY